MLQCIRQYIVIVNGGITLHHSYTTWVFWRINSWTSREFLQQHVSFGQQIKYQSFVLLASLWRESTSVLHKGPVMWKTFPWNNYPSLCAHNDFWSSVAQGVCNLLMSATVAYAVGIKQSISRYIQPFASCTVKTAWLWRGIMLTKPFVIKWNLVHPR